MTRARRHPGFTLVELLVTTAIIAVVLVAVFAVVQGQQNAFFQGNLQRAAQGSARSALSYVEQRLATAGFGMDASLAFDFTSAVNPCPALAAPCDRDRIDGNDELVFFSRNPRYWIPESYGTDPVGNAWRIVSVVGDTVTINGHPGDTFQPGRILQAVCKPGTAPAGAAGPSLVSGAMGSRYAYFTVAQRAGLAPTDSPQQLPITLQSVVTANPFRRQDQATNGCFSTGEARLFLVDRYRFHVRPVRVGAGVQPYLVMDAGLTPDGGAALETGEVIVAEGIESFQVGYVLTNGALAPRGTTAGTRINFPGGFPGGASATDITTLVFPGNIVDPSQPDYVWTSWYPYAVGPPPADNRMTDHQANIRAVKVTLVARGPEPDPAQRRTQLLLPILNQNAMPAWVDLTQPYDRARVDATVPLRDMTTRQMLDN